MSNQKDATSTFLIVTLAIATVLAFMWMMYAPVHAASVM